MSQSHIQRLNRIHAKFKRNDLLYSNQKGGTSRLSSLFEESSTTINEVGQSPAICQQEDLKWLNFPKYEAPIQSMYPKNPFSTQSAVHYSL